MSLSRQYLAVGMYMGIAFLAARDALAADASPQIYPGSQFSIEFPGMPRTLASVVRKTDTKPMMTVYLPTNYDPKRKHPLLIFLNGGDGGDGSKPATSRRICLEKDFVCVDFPLFRATTETADIKLTDPDFKFMWPLYKTMLTKLDAVVPNIDPARRVMGGFSNGAHTTAGLIEQSDGELTKAFSAFIFVEGGGRMRNFGLLKGRPLLLLHGTNDNRAARMALFIDAAKAAGVDLSTHPMKDTGHAFPSAEFPIVKDWLYAKVLQN